MLVNDKEKSQLEEILAAVSLARRQLEAEVHGSQAIALKLRDQAHSLERIYNAIADIIMRAEQQP